MDLHEVEEWLASTVPTAESAEPAPAGTGKRKGQRGGRSDLPAKRKKGS